MAVKGILKRALASCRRVLLLLLLGLTLLGAWFYWQSPKLDTMGPIVEGFLKEHLQLQEVSLGKLSWSWSGYLWLQGENLHFTTDDDLLAFHGGQVAVRMTLATLLAGNLEPDRIRLSGGRLNVHVTDDEAIRVPTRQLIFDDVALNWRYGKWHGSLPKLHLTLDARQRSLVANSPAIHFSAQMDEDGFLNQMKLHSGDVDWLPEDLRRRIQGNPVIDIELQRQGLRQWQLKASADSESSLTLMPGELYALSFNRLATEVQVRSRQDAALEFEHIDIRSLNWSLAENAISAKGRWQQGELQLEAGSEGLAMPIIWSWLRPLGEKEWHGWLAQMHGGTAHQIKAHASLTWPQPWASWPSIKAWDGMQFSVDGQVEDADISLGSDADFVLHTKARVKLDQDGLDAHIVKTELPHFLGRATGRLYIPWSSLAMQISGRARTSVTNVIAWAFPDEKAELTWHESKADAMFKLLWHPEEEKPRQAHVSLKPRQAWDISTRGLDLRLSDGSVHWDMSREDIQVKSMKVASKNLHGVTSFRAAPGSKGQWQISSLDGKLSGDFARLAAYIQLPLANARGVLSSSLHFDGRWTGVLDMKDAGWDRLLGSSKEVGESFLVNYQGELELSNGKRGVALKKIESKSKAFRFHGDASINEEMFKAHIADLHTPAFDGSLEILVPFGKQHPWEAEVKASYLNRGALPKELDYAKQSASKQWKLRGRIARFDWDDARMSGVHINLASSADSIGVFEAAQIHTKELDIQDVNARFSLPGKGQVDLRNVNASLEKQRFNMSARLTPVQGGGMRWYGFVLMSGDFGHMMKRGEISSRFLGGKSHILFSGQGVVLHNQPWWESLDGRLRLRVDDGRILEGGTLTTLLAATSLVDLPKILIGKRMDLSGPGILFERLQMEAIMQGKNVRIRNVAMRSSAFDLVGHGTMNVASDEIDLFLVAHPLQNLDAILSKLPIIRDLLGGRSHSFMRKVYRMHGPFSDAVVEPVNPEDAGLASAGIIEGLFSLPDRWFGEKKKPVRRSEAAEKNN